jgi:hypothetical protein
MNKIEKITFILYFLYNFMLLAALYLFLNNRTNTAKNIVLSVVILHFVLGFINAIILGFKNASKKRYELPSPKFKGLTLLTADLSLALICLPLLLVKNGSFSSAITIAFFGNIVCLYDYMTRK